MKIQFGHRLIDLSEPHVMGILNVTPDSFFDGGRYFRRGKDISNALVQAEGIVDAGASFIDVGGESTRPGALQISLQEEMDRVLPVVEAINANLDVVISVDSSSPEIMTQGAQLGAALLNDIRAMQKPGALGAAVEANIPVCLMHMKGKPESMQDSPDYDSVVSEVTAFLSDRIEVCRQAGIDTKNIIIDPGFGFGKTDLHNMTLLNNLSKIAALGCPVLVGLSRKSILGRLLGREPSDRLAGSLALAQHALEFGANILRVHDVAETVDVVKLFNILKHTK